MTTFMEADMLVRTGTAMVEEARGKRARGATHTKLLPCRVAGDVNTKDNYGIFLGCAFHGRRFAGRRCASFAEIAGAGHHSADVWNQTLPISQQKKQERFGGRKSMKS